MHLRKSVQHCKGNLIDCNKEGELFEAVSCL